MDTREATLLTAVVISGIVIGIIIVFFVISIVRQQRRNLLLQRQNLIAEIAAMEKERARIAADLHDDLGPVLSTIKFKIDGVETADAEETALLQKASKQVDEVIERMRSIAVNLMPSVLLRKGLAEALQQSAARWETGSSLRIVQEVMHNAVKHAGANNHKPFVSGPRSFHSVPRQRQRF